MLTKYSANDPGMKFLSIYTKMHSKSGPGCSNLTTSLVNDSLNFHKLISQIWQYVWLKNVRSFYSKLLLFFATKQFGVFGYRVIRQLTS